MAWNPTANLKGPKGDKGDTGATGAPGGAADVQAAIQNFPAGTIESSDRVPFIDMSDAYKVKMGTLGSAALAPIVGTVSQSGGVPTGAIVQRGSNANGEFVRWADGTQICWGTITPAAQSVAAYNYVVLSDWVFPAAFAVAPPFISSTYQGYGTGYFVAGVADLVATGTSGGLFLGNARNTGSVTGSNGKVHLIAIGRWF